MTEGIKVCGCGRGNSTKIDLSYLHGGYSFMRERGSLSYFRFNETLLTPRRFGGASLLSLPRTAFHQVKYFSSFHTDTPFAPRLLENLDLIDSRNDSSIFSLGGCSRALAKLKLWNCGDLKGEEDYSKYEWWIFVELCKIWKVGEVFLDGYYTIYIHIVQYEDIVTLKYCIYIIVTLCDIFLHRLFERNIGEISATKSCRLKGRSIILQ